MLLHTVSRDVRRHGHESGSALASVIGILAATAVVAATLLTTSVFAAGFTSASRASVQAQAAAEAGIEFATANLGACASGIIKSADGTRPEFSVTVAHRSATRGPWTAGCSPADAVDVRLVSTGVAEARGAAGHNRGDTRRMEAVLRAQLPRAIMGDRSIANAGSLKLPVVAGRPSDISTNGSFRCNGTLEHSGMLYVRETYTPSSSNCQTSGTLVTGAAVDPDAPENVFPRLRKTGRWPTATRTLAQVKASFGSTSPDPCSLDSSSGSSTVLAYEPIVVDATGCAAGYSLALSATLVLHGDVVIFAEKLTTSRQTNIQLRSGDGRPHRLYLVKPWPADRVGGCPSTTPYDFAFNGVLQSADNVGGAVLYSSTTITSGSVSAKKFPGQIYACALDLQGGTELIYSPTGPKLLVAKRDVG